MDRVLCVVFCIVVMVFAVCVLRYCAELPTEPTTAETTQESTGVVAEPTEAEVLTTLAAEPVATEPPETEPPVALYDVPLDAELQTHIIGEAEKYGIDPAIILAMAYRESTYNANCIGDSGKSFGLLQVQPRWHSKRMEKLECADLLDPYQNVIVAVDYLCELLNRYGSIDKALTAYNQGHYSGTVTKYAKTVLAYAEQINNERGQ